MARVTVESLDVTIRIERAHAGRLDDIVRDLEQCGLNSVERHDKFLIVNGSAAPHQIDAMRKVQGVASVRADQQYRATSS